MTPTYLRVGDVVKSLRGMSCYVVYCNDCRAVIVPVGTPLTYATERDGRVRFNWPEHAGDSISPNAELHISQRLGVEGLKLLLGDGSKAVKVSLSVDGVKPVKEKWDLEFPKPKGFKGDWPDYVGDRVIWQMLERGQYSEAQIAATVLEIDKGFEEGWDIETIRQSIQLIKFWMNKAGKKPKTM